MSKIWNTFTTMLVAMGVMSEPQFTEQKRTGNLAKHNPDGTRKSKEQKKREKRGRVRPVQEARSVAAPTMRALSAVTQQSKAAAPREVTPPVAVALREVNPTVTAAGRVARPKKSLTIDMTSEYRAFMKDNLMKVITNKDKERQQYDLELNLRRLINDDIGNIKLVRSVLKEIISKSSPTNRAVANRLLPLVKRQEERLVAEGKTEERSVADRFDLLSLEKRPLFTPVTPGAYQFRDYTSNPDLLERRTQARFTVSKPPLHPGVPTARRPQVEAAPPAAAPISAPPTRAAPVVTAPSDQFFDIPLDSPRAAPRPERGQIRATSPFEESMLRFQARIGVIVALKSRLDSMESSREINELMKEAQLDLYPLVYQYHHLVDSSKTRALSKDEKQAETILLNLLGTDLKKAAQMESAEFFTRSGAMVTHFFDKVQKVSKSHPDLELTTRSESGTRRAAASSYDSSLAEATSAAAPSTPGLLARAKKGIKSLFG